MPTKNQPEVENTTATTNEPAGGNSNQQTVRDGVATRMADAMLRSTRFGPGREWLREAAEASAIKAANEWLRQFADAQIDVIAAYQTKIG